MIVFAGATFLPMILQQMNNKDSAQRKQTMIISGVMSLFMLWISLGFACRRAPVLGNVFAHWRGAAADFPCAS